MNYCGQILDKLLTSYGKLNANSNANSNDYANVKQDDKTLNFLTGIPSDSLFQWILSLIRSDVSSILKSFTMNNHLLLILMKLKLGASNRDLSLRFDIKEEYAFKIVRT